jgi:SAM-dependent methyltransferase
MPLTVLSDDHDEARFALDDELVRALWSMEDAHFWHRARHAHIVAALEEAGVVAPARVIELGCGSGAVVRALMRRGYAVTGVDTARVLVDKAFERCPQADLYVGRAEELPGSHAGAYDAAGLFDVLEHLREPTRLLESAARLVRPSGLVVVTVPARPSLHSAIDRISGHERRYARGELGALCRSAGLVDVRERGIFASLLPLMWLSRRVAARDGSKLDQSRRLSHMRSHLRVPWKPVDRALGAAVTIERRLGLSSPRWGTTLLATGRRPS